MAAPMRLSLQQTAVCELMPSRNLWEWPWAAQRPRLDSQSSEPKESFMASAYRYTVTQRLLHWLIALVVFGLLAMGFLFWGLGYQGVVDTFGQETTNQLYTYHKSFGVLLLILMVLRLLLRRASPPPAYEKPLTGVEKLVSGGTHLLLYLLLLGMPIGGWLATWYGGFPVQFFGLFGDSGLAAPEFVVKNDELSEQLFQFHGFAGIAVAVLLLLHIGAGLKHWKLKDGVMRRISLP
jgi:cytochrome b561